MISFFHKYSMSDDIKFIKTNKEGKDLQAIQENYPNSIIDVNSSSEKNVYIGIDRITDNYNLGVDENSITNNVGGMASGINASDLKGKSVSEILDIILFASNNNLTIKGVQVVNKIENLTDGTLEDIYQGMIVSVVEDGNLYVLINIDFSDINNWKKQSVELPNMDDYALKEDIYTKTEVNNLIDGIESLIISAKSLTDEILG